MESEPTYVIDDRELLLAFLDATHAWQDREDFGYVEVMARLYEAFRIAGI